MINYQFHRADQNNLQNFSKKNIYKSKIIVNPTIKYQNYRTCIVIKIMFKMNIKNLQKISAISMIYRKNNNHSIMLLNYLLKKIY